MGPRNITLMFGKIMSEITEILLLLLLLLFCHFAVVVFLFDVVVVADPETYL